MERQVAQSSHPPDSNSKEDYRKAGLARGTGWGVGLLWRWKGCGSGMGSTTMQTTSIPSRLLLRPQATFLIAPLGGQVL